MGIAVIVFTAFTMCIGFWTYFKIRGKAINYYKAGAMMPVWVVGITLCAQAFDANGSMGAAALSYQSGFWAGASIPVGLAACLFITGFFFAKPIQRMNLMTLPDFYSRRYDKTTEMCASLSMLASNIILIAGNLAGLGLLFSLIFGVGYLPMLIVVASCILAYAVTGGLFASISTSVFQVAVFIVGMLLAFFWLTSHFGWTTLMLAVPTEHKFLAGLVSMEHGAIANWAALVSLGVGDVVAIDFMQRVISSESPRTAQRGCFYGGFLTLVVGVPAALVGLYAFHMNSAVSSDLLANIALTNLPAIIGGLLVLGIIAASMSTAAGVILALANVLTRNLVQRHMRTEWNNQTMLRFSRLIAIPTMTAAVIFAYIRPEPGTLLILAFDVVLAGCFAPLLLGIYWKKANSLAALTSIVVGAILRVALFYVVPSPLAGLDTLIPPVVTLVLFVVVALATQDISPPRAGAFDYVPTEDELVAGQY
jgi:Na+/proline symporter